MILSLRLNKKSRRKRGAGVEPEVGAGKEGGPGHGTEDVDLVQRMEGGVEIGEEVEALRGGGGVAGAEVGRGGRRRKKRRIWPGGLNQILIKLNVKI